MPVSPASSDSNEDCSRAAIPDGTPRSGLSAGNRDAKELFDKLGMVVSKFLDIKVEYIGAVPYDHNMQKAIMKQTPISILDPHSNTEKQ